MKPQLLKNFLKKNLKENKDIQPEKISEKNVKNTVKINPEMKEEIEIDEAERSLSDRLARKRKLYDKTTKKAMQFARDEGEASGHARYRMSSISREMDGIKAKMNKEEVELAMEAKVDQGRSEYGKASIRNYRRKGPGHGEPAMFDPENKRGKLIDKRREEHKARRGVKKAKVPAYKLGEEGYDRMRDDRLVKYGTGHDGSDRKGSTRYHSRPDTPEQKKRKQAASDEAYKSVVAKLKKKYGDGV